MIDLIASKSAEIADLCRRYHVRRLDVFGSAARGSDFTAESDVDLIASFDEGEEPSRFQDFFAFENDLAGVFGRKVDLLTDKPVRNLFVRRAIERDRRTIYGA